MSGETHQHGDPGDPQRPIYHITPRSGWLNDPNGLIQWGEQVHLFYQHNPHGAFHASIHWDHLVSDDLVHWRRLPIALAPTPDSPDADGCWSGVAVDDGGVPTIIYSGASAAGQRACLATSADGLLSWTKFAGNPVIPGPPPGLDLVAYRDHCVWREADGWRMLMGAGLHGGGGAALLYRSPDLRRWEYLHPLYSGDRHQTTPVWTGSMWECPDFFPLGDRHVLIVSVWDHHMLHYTVAMSGRYAGQRLTPQRLAKLDYGDRHFYAPQSFRDRQGRRIVFGWLQEGCSGAAQLTRGWSGALSLPRELRLHADGTVLTAPLPELAALRREHRRVAARTLPPGRLTPLDELRGDALEIIAELRPGPQGVVGLAVRRAPDGSEETRIRYDPRQQQLSLDRTHSSLDHETDRTTHVAPLTLRDGEPLRLHLFLDRSVIEVFANEQVAITSRIYPSRADSTAVTAFAEHAPAALLALDAWTMRSIWGDPRDPHVTNQESDREE
ncbi:MAG: glycoside hydrolase family 32 protein [Chloroflexales bacterium]|nr:glycoside hydrolase family 32 protein [Chloroflexales bacterium]